jgi:hypothetical protein
MTLELLRVSLCLPQSCRPTWQAFVEQLVASDKRRNFGIVKKNQGNVKPEFNDRNREMLVVRLIHFC